MSFFSSLGNALGGVLGVSSGDANAAQAALQSSLQSGALQAAANYGQQGAALQQQAAALNNTNVGLNYGQVDQDSAAMAALQQHYLSQYGNGGLQGQAAVTAEQAARALQAQSGIAGIHGDTLASGNAQQQVANTAQSEIAQAGGAANNINAQQAAVALQKAVLQAQVSHANFSNHLAAQQVGFALRNNQQNLLNDAQTAFNNISNQATSTSITQQQQQAQIGEAAFQALLAAGSAGAGQATQFLSNAAATPASTVGDATTPLASAPVVASPTNTGAGYVTPQVTAGTAVAPTYTPIFNTAPTLPNTASFFNRGQ